MLQKYKIGNRHIDIGRDKDNLQKMRLLFLGFALLFTLLVSDVRSQAGSTVDYSQYVNPFIGSEGPTPGQGDGGGDIFVGAARPFGTVKFGIDTTAANWSTAVLNGGWTPDGNVTAFSEWFFYFFVS